MNPSFVDTNILYYAVCGKTDPRSAPAQRLVRTLRDTGRFRTSTQVLQELFVNLVRPRDAACSPAQAIFITDTFATWPVVVPGYADVREAMQLSQNSQISYWDALIVTAARMADCDTLYTEDLNHNEVIDGVRIVNPFLLRAH